MRRLLLTLLVLFAAVCLIPAARAQDRADQPAVPQGAEYTLFVARFDGPAHVRDAKAVKDQLLRATPLRDWYVVHQSEQSLLYHGYYAEQEGRVEQDEASITGLKNSVGDPLFRRVTLVPIDAPDPDAPPQWNILNAEGMRWTLVIADYTGSIQRKQFAVESVRAAREMGIEAYYFHGPTTSSVLIGAWPQQALMVQNVDQVEARGNEERPFVVSSLQLPKGMVERALDEQGRRMEVVEPEVQVVDRSMAEALQAFPEYALNGETVREAINDPVQGRRVLTKPSFIADIQQIREVAGQDPSGTPQPGQPEGPLLVDPNQGRRGSGLRGLDD